MRARQSPREKEKERVIFVISDSDTLQDRKDRFNSPTTPLPQIKTDFCSTIIFLKISFSATHNRYL